MIKNTIYLLATLLILVSYDEDTKPYQIFDIETINVELSDSLSLDLGHYASLLESKCSAQFIRDSVIGDGVGRFDNEEIIDSYLKKSYNENTSKHIFIVNSLLENVLKTGDVSEDVKNLRLLVEKTEVSDYVSNFESGSKMRYSRFTGLITDLEPNLSDEELYYLVAMRYILFES